MKKYSNTLIVILFCLLIINSRTLFGQTQVTRYTPVGSTVRAYNQIPEMTSGDKDDWSDYVNINYPQATELNPHSATRSYNCHAYAWHISLGGDDAWIGYYDGQQGDEDIYWTDGSYIRLNSEAGADKISYYQDNHSAIQTSTQGIYKSKWGEGPLMQHARDYGPVDYYMTYRYYYDPPTISGDDLLCYPGSKTFSTQDFYNVTYAWTTSSNLQINGSNTSRTVSVSPISSTNSAGTISLSITILAYNKTRVITKNVWVGVPWPATIQGPAELPNGCIVSYSIAAQGNPTTYLWSIPGKILCPPNLQWQILYGGNQSSATYFAGCQSGYMHVTVGNDCGTAPPVGKYVDINDSYDCNGMKMHSDTTLEEPNIDVKDYLVIYPNSASDFVQVSIAHNTTSTQDPLLSDANSNQDITASYSVRVYNIYGILVYSRNETSFSFTIPVSSFINGTYIINVSDNTNAYQKQFVVKH